MKTKYRTNFAISQSLATPANSALMAVGIYDGFGTTASPFWVSGGGAISADFGVPVPTFSSNITVRGGQLGIRVCNQLADAQPIEVKVILFLTGLNRPGVGPPATANQPVGFDITQLSDFKTFYGKPLLIKSVLLENSNVVNIKYRLRVHKVDQYEYSLQTRRFYWMVAAIKGFKI